MQSDDEQKIDDQGYDGQPGEPGVGYKVPPKEHRFKKGESGNPKGRPKGAQGKAKAARNVLWERHVVSENDRQVTRTAIELVLMTLRQLAFAGNNRAFKVMEQLAADYDPQKPTKRAGLLVVPGRLTPESWEQLFGADVSAKQGEDE